MEGKSNQDLKVATHKHKVLPVADPLRVILTPMLPRGSVSVCHILRRYSQPRH